MKAEDVLDRLRGVVIVVDGLGTVTAGYGGFGGILGYDVGELVGASVFDYVVPGEVDDLAIYFLENTGLAFDVVSLPVPFRVNLIGADGQFHPVDVIPTAVEQHEGELAWVVMLVPVALQTAVSRSLELEMAGASRDDVKAMLTEEMVVDNETYSSRWFLIELDHAESPDVTAARPDCDEMTDVILAEVCERGWAPWSDIAAGEAGPIEPDCLPEAVRAVAAANDWRRVMVAPVHLRGAVVAAFVLFGRVPDGYDTSVVHLNVIGRVRSLVNVTALLIARWRERDRLVRAATHDSLTGLANRDAFFDACELAGESAAVLYVDVDRFKEINDGFGHDVGDRVLQQVARRIVAAGDGAAAVARFGGDEFVVLLDGVADQEAELVGQRVVDAFDAPLTVDDFVGDVGVSVGLSMMDGRSITDALDTADRAMLQAKRTGRSRLVVARQPDGIAS